MKKAGLVRWYVVLAGLAVIAIVALALLAGPSPADAASGFMRALQAGDVDRLTELSYVPAGYESKIRKQWEFCIHTATPYYNFRWRPSFAKKISDDQVEVSMKVIRNANNPSAYDEDFQITVVKVGDSWKVDVYRLSSKLYPALPRIGSPVD